MGCDNGITANMDAEAIVAEFNAAKRKSAAVVELAEKKRMYLRANAVISFGAGGKYGRSGQGS